MRCGSCGRFVKATSSEVIYRGSYTYCNEQCYNKMIAKYKPIQTPIWTLVSYMVVVLVLFYTVVYLRDLI